MEQHDFIITLPSNSSSKHFPDNTTTNFSTYLPRELHLDGRWSVGIGEIHIPCNILHVSREDAMIEAEHHDVCYFQHGMYKSVQDLVNAINTACFHHYGAGFCQKLFYQGERSAGGEGCGGYVMLGVKPDNTTCPTPVLSKHVKRILGMESGLRLLSNRYPIGDYNVILAGKHPASLARAIPDQLYVYSNICEPAVVGDTLAPLLRIVNIDAGNFYFGSTIVKRFNPVTYVPLLNTRFQIIDIDIRDQFGAPIAFEFGTLTVTLHFRREF